MKKLIYDIKIEANSLKEKSEEELNDRIERIKKRKEKETLDDILVEWFALVQEVSSRTIGLRHFDTQLLGGILLHQGKIVEMKTGEGKTLVSTLPVALNALEKKGVHVVTVNEYLAERDQKWMGKVYQGLGLTVGLVKGNDRVEEKQYNYGCDITYITNSELVFDYLRDSSAQNLNEVVQRPFSFCLIDEIDSVLIDEARTPLILSEATQNEDLNKLYFAKSLVTNALKKDIHFDVDEKRKDINLTENGYQVLKEKLGKETLFDPKDPWILEILNALKANHLFKLNKDYIVLKNKIVIVDEFTGRIMEDRRWNLGLHEAIEMKEGVPIGGGTKTKSSITYQNFFTLYPKLSGMTGTAKTAEKEFEEIYGLEVVVLPTVKPLLRKDSPDFVYQNEMAKWKQVLAESKQCFAVGQPILIGTTTIQKSEFLSDLFTISKIPHRVLNAKPENVTRESEIVAKAGEKFAVTIATNMAGRGTDIILGGNPQFQVKEQLWTWLIEKTESPMNSSLIQEIFSEYQDLQKLEEDIRNLPYSLDRCENSLKQFYQKQYDQTYETWKKENQTVKELGGLFVLGTERHETRRIDNQLRGRSGRQGDPGKSQFFVSLEDELIKVFGGDNIRQWVNSFLQDKDIPLESNLLTKSLENAQQKVELYNYDLRKNVFQYDDILNAQRKQLFQARTTLLRNEQYEELFLRFQEAVLDENMSSELETFAFEKEFDHYVPYRFINQNKIEKSNECYQEIWVNLDLNMAHANAYQSGFLKITRSIFLLNIIDSYWTEHIERMNYIRETINWRSYGQQNPLVEYNFEAFKSFKLMFEEIRLSMLYYFVKNPIHY